MKIGDKRPPVNPEDWITPYYDVVAVGSNIALATCKICGACLLLSEDDAAFLHMQWHDYRNEIPS